MEHCKPFSRLREESHSLADEGIISSGTENVVEFSNSKLNSEGVAQLMQPLRTDKWRIVQERIQIQKTLYTDAFKEFNPLMLAEYKVAASPCIATSSSLARDKVARMLNRTYFW